MTDPPPVDEQFNHWRQCSRLNNIRHPKAQVGLNSVIFSAIGVQLVRRSTEGLFILRYSAIPYTKLRFYSRGFLLRGRLFIIALPIDEVKAPVSRMKKSDRTDRWEMGQWCNWWRLWWRIWWRQWPASIVDKSSVARAAASPAEARARTEEAVEGFAFWGLESKGRRINHMEARGAVRIWSPETML